MPASLRTPSAARYARTLINKPLPHGHQPGYDRSEYTRWLEPPYLQYRLKQAIKALQSWKHLFEAIAFRGMSGALLAPPVAMYLHKSLILVRNTCDTHSWREGHGSVEGDKQANYYVIVDDFRSTGDTMERIMDAIQTWAPQARCIGLLEADRITPEKLAEPMYPLRTKRGGVVGGQLGRGKSVDQIATEVITK